MTAPANQFAPLSLAREILASPERYGEQRVEWARGVVEEAECDERQKSMPCKRP